MLYIVPTPIGNLEDITLRALRILKECDLILAEDTRTSGVLLKHFDITTPLGSFHAFNEHKSLSSVLQKLQSGAHIALISDAGTPGISDPGFLLVRACLEQEIEVCCLPGPTAFVPALVASGLSSDRFQFEGFLPHKKGRQTKWKYIAGLELTVILYESPYRLVKCLEEICTYLSPERKVCVAREISKRFEDIRTDTAERLVTHYSAHPPKGEIVVVIDAKQETKKIEKEA